MDPNFAMAHNQLAQAYLQKHMSTKRSQNCKRRSSFLELARRASLILLGHILYPARGAKRLSC